MVKTDPLLPLVSVRLQAGQWRIQVRCYHSLVSVVPLERGRRAREQIWARADWKRSATG